MFAGGKIFWKWLLIHSKALWIAFLITAIVSTGLLDDLDCKVSDRLYQKSGEPGSDIVIVGIDPNTLNKLGPVSSWVRRDLSKAIIYLNDNPETRPAVIGLDFLFSGNNSEDPDSDRKLAEVAARYGNVVVGSSTIIDENFNADNPYAVWNKTFPWDAPFPHWQKPPTQVTPGSRLTRTGLYVINFCL